MEAMATIVSSLVIAFMYGWKLAVIIIGFLPVLMWTARVQARVFEERPKSGKRKTGHAGEVRSRAHVVILYRFPPFSLLVPPFLSTHPHPTRSLSLFLSLSVCQCLSLSVCLSVCLSLHVWLCEYLCVRGGGGGGSHIR